MQSELSLLVPVALKFDMPKNGLLEGQVGTIVEVLEPGVFEVEFADAEGKTYAMAALPAEKLIALHYRQVAA